MSAKARVAALQIKAAKGDAKASAELEELKAMLASTEEEAADDEDEAADDEEAGDGDDKAEDEDDDAKADDDEADAEDEDDDAEAVINHPSAKGREALAAQLSLKVARSKLTKAEALNLLGAAPKGGSFRETAGKNTPSGVRAAAAQQRRESGLVAAAKARYAAS